MNKSRSLIQTIKEDIGAAFMLLTRISINWHKISPDQPPDLNRCLWVYPFVGLVVGSMGAVVYCGSIALSIPQYPSIILCLGAMILATGAFHEDGLADVMDGFGGGLTKEKKLDIMRDSRIGTYGGLALIFSMILKFTSLINLSDLQLMFAIIIGASISRLMILVTLLFLSPAREDSLSTAAGIPSYRAMITASIIALLPPLLFLNIKMTVIIFLVALLTTAIMSRISYKQIGGYSGDVLGAIQQISEISIFITLAAIWGMK